MIASLEKYPANSGKPVSASVPTVMTANVYGIFFQSPPMLRMSCS
ncbi:hypothetical protein ACVWYH_008613 [Bradyrhizobium sp. GM24.11]